MRRWAAIVGLAAMLVLGGCHDDSRVHYRHAGQIFVTRGNFRITMDGWHIGAAKIDCMVSEMGEIRSVADLTLDRAAMDGLFSVCGVNPAKVWWWAD